MTSVIIRSYPRIG